ncbi:MAG: RusA family crossover junction endodeoxyribonuclease [Burkholderiales bacterium]
MASTPLPLPADKQPTRRAFPLAVLGRHGKQAQPAALPELRASIAPERLTLSLPVPPSINHQYATVNGRRLLSAAGRQYKAVVGQQVLIALARSPHRAPLLRALRANDLALSIRFYFVSPLRRDVDGGLKIAQDALCEALGLNDNRVAEIYLYKTRDAHHPRIELSLHTL